LPLPTGPIRKNRISVAVTPLSRCRSHARQILQGDS
jgi:hypothetical protein